MEAARKIFPDKGYLKTSISEISRQAGVGYGTIYTHFSGKDDILLHLVEDIIRDFAENAELEYSLDNIEDVNRMNYQEQTYFLNLAIKHRSFLRVLKEASHHSPGIENYTNLLLQRYVNKSIAGIGYAQQKGLARPLNKHIMAKCKLFLITGFFWELVYERENDPEEIIKNIIALFSTGLYTT